MDAHTEVDRKRKAEDELYDESSKKPLLDADSPTEGQFHETKNETVKADEDEEHEPSLSEENKRESEEENEQEEENLETKEVNKEDQAKPLKTIVPFDCLIVLHLEATCDENPTNPAAVQVTKENSEIIELSFVVLNASNLEVLYKQHIYVKPERTPLTDFCSEVTGIKWSDIEEAGSLKDAISILDDYIRTEIEEKGKSFCFVTHGGWVLRIQLPRECRDKHLALPNYLEHCRMFDLKQEIQRWQVHHPEVNIRLTSLRELCDLFDLDRVADETVGLNAVLTTVNVLRYLTSFCHEDVFVHPIDTNADLNQFKKEESKVIHLAGLPFEVTQGELEAWFSSNGLRPTSMLMIQASDSSKPSISGFVVFQLHDDAMRALALNGRCLGDRPIEVCPSSSRVIDAAGNMLVPFPLQAKSRQLRPGDWNCFNCGFHNFASRRHCFKCNAENPSPAPQASNGPPITTFNPNDWMCTNPSCNFHNYASRMQCKKCGGYKPGGNKLNNTAPSQSHHMTLHNGPSGAAPPTAGPSGYGGGYTGGRPHHNITLRPGDWYCPNPQCGFQNFASRHSCYRCQTPIPNQGQQQQQYSPHQPGYGYSADSNVGGSSASYGGGVGGSSGGYGYGQASGGGYGSQGSGNGSYSAYGGGYGGGGSGGYAYGGGHQSGPPGGGGYSYGGGGSHNNQFRPGDWMCGNDACKTHNYASRSQCFKCNAAKPYNPQSGAAAAGYTQNAFGKRE